MSAISRRAARREAQAAAALGSKRVTNRQRGEKAPDVVPVRLPGGQLLGPEVKSRKALPRLITGALEQAIGYFGPPGDPGGDPLRVRGARWRGVRPAPLLRRPHRPRREGAPQAPPVAPASPHNPARALHHRGVGAPGSGRASWPRGAGHGPAGWLDLDITCDNGDSPYLRGDVEHRCGTLFCALTAAIVTLRGGDRGVTRERLHRREVGAGVEGVADERAS